MSQRRSALGSKKIKKNRAPNSFADSDIDDSSGRTAGQVVITVVVLGVLTSLLAGLGIIVATALLGSTETARSGTVAPAPVLHLAHHADGTVVTLDGQALGTTRAETGDDVGAAGAIESLLERLEGLDDADAVLRVRTDPEVPPGVVGRILDALVAAKIPFEVRGDPAGGRR